MKLHVALGAGAGTVLVLALSLSVRHDVASAGVRMNAPEMAPKAAIADNSEAPYCTPAFKQVLQRVLNACGLLGGESRRGCQPADVKGIASIGGEDFNALFRPLAKRGAIVLFDEGQDKLDDGALKLIEDRWLDRQGARYFFIVARGSKSGTDEQNRALSHKRANSVLFRLNEVSHEQDLEKKVGLLWLGKEFAQLSREYCDWQTSRETKDCDESAINRSAFISWVDCRL